MKLWKKVLSVLAVVTVIGGGAVAYAATTNHAMTANSTWNVTCPNSLTPSNQAAESITLNCAANPTTTTTQPVTTTTQPVTGGPTYTLQPGSPYINENYTGHSGTTVQTEAITIPSDGVGDAVVVYAHDQSYSGNQHVTSVTDSAGDITWGTADVTKQPAADDTQQELWFGTVKATGSTTVSVHWADSDDDGFVYVYELHASDGGTWSVAQAGNIDEDGGDSITVTWPNLISSADGGVYLGMSYLGEDAVNNSQSPTSFSGELTTFDNYILWNLNLSPNTGYAPTNQQVSASGWDTVAVTLSAS